MDADVTVSETPAAPESSLADHEAQYAPGATLPEAPAAEDGSDEGHESGTRDAKGRFKQEHRAQSQQAKPDDVASIAAQTKRLREAEDAFGIEKQAGESERVYQLRRRAEIAELAKAQRAVAAAPAPSPAPRATPPPAPAAVATVPPKPDPEKFTYGTADPDYIEALTDWKTDRKFEALEAKRAADAATAQREADTAKLRQGWVGRLDAAKAALPDFETAVFGVPQAQLPPLLQPGTLAEAFVFEASTGPYVLYHLLKTPAEVARLSALSGMDLVEALTLLGQRLTSKSRVPDVTTGSPATPAPSSVPRPPNPVRTGPLKAADEPPGDDASLADHERYFAPRTR